MQSTKRTRGTTPATKKSEATEHSPAARVESVVGGRRLRSGKRSGEVERIEQFSSDEESEEDEEKKVSATKKAAKRSLTSSRSSAVEVRLQWC